MPEPPQPVVPPLRMALKRLRRRQIFKICAEGFVLFGGLTLLLQLVDWLAPVRELPAALCLIGALLLAAGWLVARLVLVLVRRPSVTGVAHAVERVYPELMDSLICAAEVEARPGGEVNDVERELLARVSTRITDLDVAAAAIPGGYRMRRLLLLGLAASLVAGVSLNTRVAAKAAGGWRSLFDPGACGMVVTPGDREVAVGADVRISAVVERWEKKATVEVVDAAGARRHEMNEEDGTFHFTMYQVDSAVRYRILTPSLGSPWFTLRVFTPPQLDAFTGTLIPPDYTGAGPIMMTEMTDFTVLAGTRARFSLQGNLPGIMELVENGEVRATTVTAAGRLTGNLDTVLDSTRKIGFVLREPASGRELRTPEITFTVVPDAAPSIEIVEPADDPVVKPGDAVDFRVRAVDDYGLAEIVLHASVGGRKAVSFRLHEFAGSAESGNPASDVTVWHPLDTGALGAEAGDVVACYATAVDRRQPEPQTARSRIVFIEIRPDIEPNEMPGMPQQSVDVMRIIAELRRLVRLSHDAAAAEGDRHRELNRELTTGLSDLRIEVTKQMDEIRQGEGGPAAAPLIGVYQQGLDRIEEARRLARLADYPPAIGAQEKALTLFTRLAQELMKNSSSQPDQNQQKSSSGSGGKEGRKTDSEEKMSLAEAMQRLKEAQAELQRMADRQGALNSRMERARGAGAGEMGEMADQEKMLGSELGRLREELATSSFMEPVSAGLGDAGRAMESAAGSLEQGDLPGGGRHGARAQKALLEAVDQTRQVARRLAAKQIENLAEGMGTLADLENKLADYTQQAEAENKDSRKTADALREAQRKIGGKTEQLMHHANRLAADLQEVFPEAGEALEEALKEAGQRNLSGTFAKAENALLYSRLKRAAGLQREAAEEMRTVAQKMYLARDRLPQVSREELLQAMAEAQRAAQKASQGEGEDTAAAVDRAARTLSKMGLQIRDPGLMEIAGNVAAAMEQRNQGEGRMVAAAQLRQAVELLRRHLLSLEVGEREELSRKLSRPPEKYRRLVEEYFKALSEEK